MAATPHNAAPQGSVMHAARVLLSLTAANVQADPRKAYAECIAAFSTLYAANELRSLVPLLPLLLAIKGKPMNLERHFVMEPVYSLQATRRTVFKTARQVSKSTGLAASRLLQSATMPYFSSLYMAPLYSQTTRFSTLVLRPMLKSSPIRDLLIEGAEVLNSVLQMLMTNGSVQHFSFAFHDAERVRSISADAVDIDEVQDMNPEFLPVIEATMDASPLGIRRYFGTPKTSDNLLQTLFDDSSGAEWVTKCSGCNRDNIATVSHHLMDMIQAPGPSCYKCGKLLDPSAGHYEHERPERRHRFRGYHAPQAIMPFHYADPEKWFELFTSKTKMAPTRFLNEKCGESCDVMATLISKDDLRKASILKHSNLDDDDKALRKLAAGYPQVTLGVDWGGYGAAGISYTAIVLLGHLPDGKIDVLRMRRLVMTTGDVYEAQRVLQMYAHGRCYRLGHDFNGAGAQRETLLIQAGFPIGNIVPQAYTGNTTQAMVSYHAPSAQVVRGYYGVDKPRAISLVAALIKSGMIRFPVFDSWSQREGDVQSLSEDFTAVTADHVELDRASTVMVIRKKPGRCDDTLHGLVYGAIAYWQTEQRFPDVALASGLQITAAQAEQLSPMHIDFGAE